MLVAVAFKYYAGSRRAAWRVLSSIQKKENNKGASENVGWIKEYKTKLETELDWRAAENFETGLKKTVQWHLESEWWWRPLQAL